MKVTQKMIQIYADAWHRTPQGAPGDRTRAGLEEVLKDVPDVVPFAFAGYPDAQVFIHSTCGTVVDMVPGSSTWDQVQAAECDCENVAPWHRVYVEREASK